FTSHTQLHNIHLFSLKISSFHPKTLLHFSLTFYYFLISIYIINPIPHFYYKAIFFIFHLSFSRLITSKVLFHHTNL
ncbi:hypothetical protein VIGAN_01427600, partial [Vigna angularis var. angularis]